MAVDDRGGKVDELAVVGPGVLAQHLPCVLLVDGVSFHQDAFGAFDQRSASERPFEIVVLREAAQHDVDRALPVLDVRII